LASFCFVLFRVLIRSFDGTEIEAKNLTEITIKMAYRRGKFFKQTIGVLFERIEKRIINRIQLNGGLVDTENPEISQFTLVGNKRFSGL
jgi:hypothetical protein